MAEALHAATQNATLLTAIQFQHTAKWELWDLLELLASDGYDTTRLWRSPIQSAENICRIVPPETFRMYSISAAMRPEETRGATELHLTVGRVRYEDSDGAISGVDRRGTASNFLARGGHRTEPLPFVIVHPPRFSLPKDPATPIVLIAGGTGIAPFRGFIQERLRQPNAGETWLFLGLRSRELFYYREELQAAVAAGKLKLRVAFSRDELEAGAPRYVQDLLVEDETAGMLWNLLQPTSEGGAGARVYVCGRSAVGSAVNAAFTKVFARFGEPADASRRLASLMAEGRYMLEIFSGHRPWDVEREQLDVSAIIRHNDETHGYWLVIDGAVYDITQFVLMHPGGARVLQGYAGMDATQGYLRAHKTHSEIDAMREMYEIGVVRHIDFAGVSRTVKRSGVEHTVALAALHRAWVNNAFLAVEMQNALRNDQSLQIGVTTRGERRTDATLYKLQRAIETHERFLRSYLGGLMGAPFVSLWEMVQGMCAPDRDARWMDNAFAGIRQSWSARHADATLPLLKETIQGAIAGNLADDLHLRLEHTIRFFEVADARFLDEIKSLLAEGLMMFEIHGATTLEGASAQLVSLLSALPSRVRTYYDTLRRHCEAAGWAIAMENLPLAAHIEEEHVMVTVLSTSFWLMDEDVARKVVILRRSAVAVQSIDELIRQNDDVIGRMRPDHSTYGIVVDMRQAPSRNDPQFEEAMRKLRAEIARQFVRVAVLVNSAVGVLQVNRIGRNERTTTFATQSESAAVRFAMGDN